MMGAGMMRLAGLIAGLVFGAGLALSGMTSPMRVLGFLDVTGAWDPSLAFVLGGALLVALPLFALARMREARAGVGAGAEAGAGPAKAAAPAPVDLRLVGGSALFGVGWGLAGICPGPALVDLAIDPYHAGLFAVPMIAAMLLSRRD